MPADPDAPVPEPTEDAPILASYQKDRPAIRRDLRRQFPWRSDADVDEAIQEAYTRVIQKIRANNDVANIGGYVRMTALNQLRTWRVEAKRTEPYDPEVHRDPEIDRTLIILSQDLFGDPFDRLDAQQRVEALRKAFGALSPQQREALRFRSQGLTYAEIGERFDLGTSRAAQIVAEAITILQERIHGHA
jgi:RNA polymerase sigma factor (sigma-70 family)